MSDGRLIFDTEINNDGFEQDIEKLKASVTDKTKVMGSAFEATGAKLTNFITKPALAATGALAGMALVKGFNRLKNIDTARAQLEGLGHSAKEVEAIMDSAMESVKGTSYGFDEAATAAASAVAAGIAPGKELVRYLSLVGDAAAQSKLSFTEMGSIFNKIMAGGRISMEEVNQLVDQSVPIYKMLSEQLGVTQADVREMVSAGKVDSKAFLNAIETNIGGAAKMMGEKSFVGALSNMGASLSRIGANFLDAGGKSGGFFSQLKPLMVDAMETMGKLESKASDWGVAFGKAFSTVVNVVKSIPAPVLGIGTAFSVSIGPAFKLTGAILKASAAMSAFKAEQAGMSVITGLATGKISMQDIVLNKFASGIKTVGKGTAAAFGGIKKAVSEQIGIFKTQNARLKTCNTLYGENTPAIYKAKNATAGSTAANVKNYIATGKLGKALKTAGTAALTFAKNQITSVAATAKDTSAKVVNAVATSKVGMAAKGAATRVLAFATAHKVALAASLGLVGAIAALAIYMGKTGASAEDVANMITGFADKLAGMITQFANELPGMINSLMPAITQVVESLITVLPALILAFTQTLIASVPALIEAGTQFFMSLVQSLNMIIEPLIETLPIIINTIVALLPTFIPMLINAAITLFMTFVKAIPKIIPALITALPKIIQAIAGAVPVLIPALLQAAITLFMALIQAIPIIVVELIKAMPKIIRAIATGIISGVGKIFSVGVQLLKKLWSGIRSWTGNLKSKVFNFAKSIPGKIKDGIGSLVDIGKDFIKGLWNGIKEKFDSVIDKVKKLANKLPKAVKKVLGIASPSRVMAEIGRFFTQGLGIGIASKTRELLSTARAQMQSLRDVYSADIGNISVTRDLGARFAGTKAQSVANAEMQGTAAYTQNNYFYRPEESPIETARALKNQNTFGLAGGWV